MRCAACPRRCGAERTCISGTRGSGAVFFSGCNLSCVFCQNHVLHDGTAGRPHTPEQLAGVYLALQADGAHNINLVTPTPHLAAVRASLLLARRRGLSIPVVYNTNAYELVPSLRALEGLVDVYLPDLKYVTPALSARFSGCADYFAFAAPAIQEMYRQVGTLRLDGDGMAVRGLLIRHLVLPACVDEARRVLDFIADSLPAETHLSLMRQYAPTPNVTEPPLNRRLTDREYARAVDYCCARGFTNVWIQGRESASLAYTPDFDAT